MRKRERRVKGNGEICAGQIPLSRSLGKGEDKATERKKKEQSERASDSVPEYCNNFC
jgi:hypothetical protein